MNHWSSLADWQGKILWAGSEAASGQYNGFLEGALVASEQTLQALMI